MHSPIENAGSTICTSHNPKWDPNSILAIPTQPRQSRDTQLLLEGRSRNKIVVGRATMYKRGMTVPESKTTPTACNHHTRSAERQHLAAHLPAENRSSRLQDECTLEEITSWVNKQNDDMDTQMSDSNYSWRRNRKHTQRKAGEQLEMISTPSTERMSSVPTSALTRRMISVTARALQRL